MMVANCKTPLVFKAQATGKGRVDAGYYGIDLVLKPTGEANFSSLTNSRNVVHRITLEQRKNRSRCRGSSAEIAIPYASVDCAEGFALHTFIKGEQPAKPVGGVCFVGIEAHRNALLHKAQTIITGETSLADRGPQAIDDLILANTHDHGSQEETEDNGLQ